MRWRKKIRKIRNFEKLKSPGNNTEAPVISKRLKFPLDDRTGTSFIAPLRMHLWRSKSTLDSLKRVFDVFRKKPSLTAAFHVNMFSV